MSDNGYNHQDVMDLEVKYNELIMAVASKWPNESRHEAALRYINQAESHDDECASEGNN